MNSDKSATKLGLVGRYLTVLYLKTSGRALSAIVRWKKTICRGSRVPQLMRNFHESRVNKPLFKHGGDQLGPKTKRVSRDKKSASVRQADVSTNLTKNRLVCGSLKSTNHIQSCNYVLRARAPAFLFLPV